MATKVNLKRVYSLQDGDNNPVGYGPGVAEVPEEMLPKLEQALKRRGETLEIVPDEPETPVAPEASELPEPFEGFSENHGLPQSPDADGNVLTAPGDGIEKTPIEIPADGTEAVLSGESAVTEAAPMAHLAEGAVPESEQEQSPSSASASARRKRTQ